MLRFAQRDDIPALPQIALAHAQFETIHPFADGNGRTGRALIQAMLRSKGLTRNVTVPVSAVANPVAGTPSHIQQTYAQLVSALPVNDAQGQTHSGMPALATEQDYHDYITSRSAAWTAARANRT